VHQLRVDRRSAAVATPDSVPYSYCDAGARPDTDAQPDAGARRDAEPDADSQRYADAQSDAVADA
jgi:hypothetical protein